MSVLGDRSRPTHRSLNWVWDVGLLDWVMMVQSGGGGGGGTSSTFGAAFPATGTAAGAKDASGNMAALNLDASGFLKVNVAAGGGTGAVTVANGADVAEGNTADAAVITDAAGTVSGKLRGLVKWAFERMPASLGQKAMAASLPVVIASDQTFYPVSIRDFNSGANLGVDGFGDARTRLFNSDGDDVVVASGHTLDAGFGILSLVSDGANVHGMKSDTDGTAQVDLMKVGGAALTEGQKTMAASVPVVIASDQSAVPVSGTVAVSGTLSAHTDLIVPTSVTGTIHNNASSLAIPTSNAATVIAQITATDVASVGGTVQIVGSTDGGTSYGQIAAYDTATNALIPHGIITSPKDYSSASIFLIPCAGLTHVALFVIGGALGGATGWTLKLSASSGTPQFAGVLVSNRGFNLIGDDNLNYAHVTASSVPAVAADSSLVVALSPNTPLPVGTNALGSVTIGSLARINVDPVGGISTDSYNAYRLQEKQLLTEVATSILSMLNDEISTSHRMGYEVR